MFRDWERLWLRASNYKHHRIFTLRCLHKELIPVSIKLKSTLKTEKATKIIRKAEKELLQARVKAINSILDNVAKQTQLCRSQLASILSAQRLRECQGFIDKVGEIRFTEVKQRQLNKFNNLLNKKEGNITNSPPNLGSQAGSQAGAHLPLGEGGSLSKQVLTIPLGKEAVYLRQAVRLPRPPRQLLPNLCAHLPPGEGSNLGAQATQSGRADRCSPSLWGKRQLISGRQPGFQGIPGSYFPARQAGRHSPYPWGRRQFFSGRQSGFPDSYFPARCSPSLWGRKQLSSLSGFPGRCSPFPLGRKQTGRCSPSSWGKK